LAQDAALAAAEHDRAGARGEARGTDEGTRPSRPASLRRFSGASPPSRSDPWFWGTAGIALVLALCGGLVAGARRFLPQAGGGGVQIVSRVSLSPKHAVYVLRIGRRMLLVGSGPQGPPALISELDDASHTAPAGEIGEQT
jgi:hypothetical protein